MCKWNPASEIPPVYVEIVILEEKIGKEHITPYFGFCFENEDVPGEYIWNIFTEYGGMQPRETICPAYWLQLPHYPISE